VQVNDTILRWIVTYPDQDYFYVTDFSAFAEILDRLLSQTCRVVQCATPTPAPTPGERHLLVLYRPEYRQPSCGLITTYTDEANVRAK